MSSRSAPEGRGGSEAQGKLIGQTLSLSAPAAAHVKKYLLQKGKARSPIRVSAVRTHCMGGRGYGYNIEEDSAKADDLVVESDGLKILVDQESLQHLRGARIEYEESLQGGGLVVRNPNAVGQCHCGRHDIFDREALSESGKC